MPRDSEASNLQSGSSFPLGATVTNGGVNFSVFSKGSTAQVVLFDSADALEPSRVIDLDPLSKPTTIGMFLYRGFQRAKFTDIAFWDR